MHSKGQKGGLVRLSVSWHQPIVDIVPVYPSLAPISKPRKADYAGTEVALVQSVRRDMYNLRSSKVFSIILTPDHRS